MTYYGVVTRDGKLKNRSDRGGMFHVYARRKTAEKYATSTGDTVVELTWDTDKEPLFIRKTKVEP